MTHRATTVLVVTPSSDAPAPSDGVWIVIEELRSRPDVRLALWHLARGERDGLADRTVDDLRVWRPAAVLERIGAGPIAAHLRGIRLRRWRRRLDPDVVVLVDVPPGAEPPVHRRVTTVRWSTSVDATPPGVPADLVVSPSTAPTRPSADHMRVPNVLPVTTTPGMALAGWGPSDEVAASFFVRTLWALQHHHGLVVEGLWLDDPEEPAWFRSEIDRCGLPIELTLGAAARLRATGRTLPALVASAHGAVAAPAVRFVADPVLQRVWTAAAAVPDADAIAVADAAGAAAELQGPCRASAAPVHDKAGPWVDDLLERLGAR